MAKLDLEILIPGQPGFWRNWTSQFLKKFVRNAAAAREFEIAEKAALEMTASLAKVQAVAFMMQQWNKARDKDAARRLLVEAIKIAGSIADEFETAKAFLLLSMTCGEVDESLTATPTTLLIDNNGKVEHAWVGGRASGTNQTLPKSQPQSTSGWTYRTKLWSVVT